MVFISEVYLVWNVIEELSVRGCIQGFRLRLGEEVMSSHVFKNIFEEFTRGTIFENVDMDIEEVSPMFKCGCGYWRRGKGLKMDDMSCPRCKQELEMFKGNEFELLDVY